ncbi:hypothetical protein GCM10023212_32560 [Luteolibacter yonseiensis]
MAHTIPDDTMYLGLREEMGAEKYDAMKMRMEQEENERENFILHTPGITPYLMFLLNKEYESRGTSFISIMVAISKRNDLGEVNLKKITDEMNRILATPSDKLNASRETTFLIGGVNILRKFPSPENEDLAIRVLTRTDRRSWRNGKLAAAETLAIMGTKRSLPHLEQAQKWAESNSEGDDYWNNIVTEMTTYNRDLKRRMEGVRNDHTPAAHDGNSRPGHGSSQPVAADGRVQEKLYWLLGLLGFLGLMAAVVRYRRSRAV